MTHHRRLLVVAALAALLIVLGPPRTAGAGVPARWSEPEPIGSEIPSSWFPDIQADSTGTVRLVWTVNLAEGDGNLTHAATGAVMLSQHGATGWSKPADIFVMDAGIASRPLIASDGVYAHLLFRTGLFGTVRLYYTRAPLSADLRNAQVWSAPYPISEGDAYYAQLVVLPDGGMVALYNALVVPPGEAVAAPARPGPAAYPGTPPAASPPTVDRRRAAVLARRSTDQGETWSVPTRVSDTDDRAARTALAVGPGGRTLLASWDEGYDNMTAQGEPTGIGTAMSSDGGATWRSQQAIRSPLGPVEQGAVALGADGPLLVYRANEQNQLLYRVGLDGGARWSEERVIPNAVPRPYGSKHNFDKLALAIDGDGRALLAFVGQDQRAPKGLSVMVAMFAGGAWSEPIRVASPDGYPEYPRLAVALGNQVHLAYFVRDKEFDLGHYTLWAVQGRSDARVVAPARSRQVPAPTPPVVPTAPPPVQVQFPPPPAVPPPLADDRGGALTPQDEVSNPAVAAMVGALLAVAALFSLVGGYRYLCGLRR